MRTGRSNSQEPARAANADGTPPPSSRLVAGIAILLAVATVVCYWGLAHSSFLTFDDTLYVTENYHVSHGLTLPGIRWAFTAFEASNWHPITWLSHMLDVSLFGLRPGPHHLVSLLLHVLNAILLFVLFQRTTARLWASAFIAALFALHPLHVESVAWVAERKDVLSTFFWLATICAYVHYAAAPSPRRYAAVALLFALGLMAKPMLVTLPAILLLLDYWPLERLWSASPDKNGPSLWRLCIEKLPLAAMAAVSALLTLKAQQASMAAPDAMDMATRFTNAIVSYGRYVWQMLWPAGLASFYPHPHKPLYVAAAIIAILMVAVTVIIIRFRHRCRYLLFGWLWYLITLLPVIGIVQVGDQISHNTWVQQE